jgi:hypothetical protein
MESDKNESEMVPIQIWVKSEDKAYLMYLKQKLRFKRLEELFHILLDDFYESEKLERLCGTSKDALKKRKDFELNVRIKL